MATIFGDVQYTHFMGHNYGKSPFLMGKSTINDHLPVLSLSHLQPHPIIPSPTHRAHRWHASSVSASVTGAWSPEGSTSRQRKKCCRARFRSCNAPRWWLGMAWRQGWDGNIRKKHGKNHGKTMEKPWKTMEKLWICWHVQANSRVNKCESGSLSQLDWDEKWIWIWIHMNSHEFTDIF